MLNGKSGGNGLSLQFVDMKCWDEVVGGSMGFYFIAYLEPQETGSEES